jgi:hypothetical protein
MLRLRRRPESAVFQYLEFESAFNELGRPRLVMVPWIRFLFGVKHRFTDK